MSHSDYSNTSNYVKVHYMIALSGRTVLIMVVIMMTMMRIIMKIFIMRNVFVCFFAVYFIRYMYILLGTSSQASILMKIFTGILS